MAIDGMLVMVYGTNRIAEGHVRKKGLLPFMINLLDVKYKRSAVSGEGGY